MPTSHFNGAVTVSTIAFKPLPFTDGGSAIFPSGELAQITNGEPFRFLAYGDFNTKSGLPRGNHYHKSKTEHLYVLTGSLTAVLEDVSTKERMSIELASGDVIVIAPGIAHAYIAHGYTQFVEFSPSVYDGGDTYAHLLTEPVAHV